MKKLILLPKIATVLTLLVCSTAWAEEDIQAVVAKKTAIIKNMHDKAARAIVQVAQDKAFRSYFSAPHKHDAHNVKKRIDHISLAVQSKFHVEEMCLIDATGTEVSRIVRNQIAYDLSTEEADNAFFAPSFKRKPRTTYIAPLYISPDVAKWVLAYTTPIDLGGKNVAILHYEHGLDVYQAALNKEPVGADSYIVAIDRAGFIVSDSRKEIPTPQHGDFTDPARYFEKFSLGGKSLKELSAALDGRTHGVVTAGGATYTISFQSVADWTIMGVQAKSGNKS